MDITNTEEVNAYMDMQRPDIVINCAGLTDLEVCEKNPVLAYKVNALGARNLAASSRRIGAKIIHISTDDVFWGADAHPLTEFDMPSPNTVYGKSKLAGENMVRELNPKHLIIRSSWVYGNSPRGYVERLLNHVKTEKHIQVPNDQISSPTSASVLADFIASLLETTEYGIYHASCEGSCTRYEFAKTILEMAGINDVEVEAVFSEKTNKPGHPRCTLLQNLMMEMTEIYHMPKWRDALSAYFQERQDS